MPASRNGMLFIWLLIKIEVEAAGDGTGKMADAQAVFAVCCMLRCLILLLRWWIEVGQVGNFM